MKTLHILSPLAMALLVAACSGSPGSEPVPVAPTVPKLSTTSLQGIWRSPAGAASTMSAVVLPDGKLWALISNANGVRVLKGGFEVQANSFAASGKSFLLGTTTSAAVTLTASVVEKSSLTGTISTAGAEPFSLAFQPRYETPATLGDFAGTWNATLGPGNVNWTISATGALTGTRTTGCTYSGQLSLRGEAKAVVDVTVTENCASTLTHLAGVGTKTEDKSGVSMLLANDDNSAAVALSLSK